jgi:TPR repeat protein
MAQFQLAQWYETGWEGVLPQNTIVARRLYTAAASHGMKAAQEALTRLGPEPAAAPAAPVPPPSSAVPP